MKTNHNDKLLSDVLNEGSERFRQDLLQASLAELRRRRRFAKVRPRLLLAIAVGLAISIGLLSIPLGQRSRQLSRLPDRVQAPPAPAYVPMKIVTRVEPAITIVESRADASLVVQNASVRRPVEMLSDTALLALFPDKPAGLVADSHGAIQLVLLDPQPRLVH